MPRTFYLIFLSQDGASGCVWAIQDKLLFHAARWISRVDTFVSFFLNFNNDTEVHSQKIFFFFLTNAPLCCVVLMQSQSRSRSIKSNWLKVARWRCVPGACVLPLQSRVYNLHIMLHQANRKTRGSLTPSDLSQGEKGSVAFSCLPFPPPSPKHPHGTVILCALHRSPF